MGAKRYESIVWVLAAIILLAGCQQPATLVPTPQPSECSPTDVEIIWPQLQAVQPDQAEPGGEVKIIASGGYQIECGNFYNESHRLFAVYFNQDRVGMLSCMANYCEVSLAVPEHPQPGTHIISTEGGSQIEIEIVEGGSLAILEWGEELPASLKGYELYSWFDENGWRFTLISGTNRSKTVDEILSEESFVTPEGWVKITVSGVQALLTVLDNLPGAQEIFWLDGARIEGAGGDTPFNFPQEDIILQVQQHSNQSGLKLLVVQ
jgi:hypothetical protein